jgi:membrane protein implicated in regulation of membrane protease activity
MTQPTNGIVADVEAFLARFKTPQTAIAALGALVAAFGSIGILDTPLVGWLQGVLSAALALITAFAARPITAALVKRAARKANAAARPTRINPAA